MDYLHITLETGPFIAWTKLRDAIAQARQPDRSGLKGVDAIAGLMRRAPSSNDEFPVKQALTAAHKEALIQALPDLPPLYTGMNPEEVEAFQEAHRNHPVLRNFDVPYPYSKSHLQTDAQARSNLKRHYEAIFNNALAEQRITGINRDEFLPLCIIDGQAQEVSPFTKLERTSVAKLLLELGFITDDTASTPAPGLNTPLPVPTKKENTATTQRTHERVVLVARAFDETEFGNRQNPHHIYAKLIQIIESEPEKVRCFRISDKDGTKVIVNSSITKSGTSKKAGRVFAIKHLEQTLKTVKNQRCQESVALQPQPRSPHARPNEN